MNLSQTNVDFQNDSNTNIDTSSAINSSAINSNTPTYDTSNYQTSNPSGGYNVEEFDLTEEVPVDNRNILQKAGDWIVDAAVTAGDWIVDTANTIYDTGAEIVNDIKTWAETNLLGIGSTLAETAANLAADVVTIGSKLASVFAEGYARLVSTGAVITTSIVSGVGKVAEGIVDGIAWAEGKIIRGGSWLIGKVAGLFSSEAEQSITEFGKSFEQASKEFMAVDWIGKANDWFYQTTGLGKLINEYSYMKYDSEAAKKIREISQKAAEFAAATALTIATGGLATFAVGALYGMGKAGESTYQRNGTDTSLLQELGIAGSGALTGISWLATGKLGKGLLEVGKTAAAIGTKQVISQISKDVLTKDFWMKAIKEGLTGANGVGNHIASAMMTGEEFIPYLTGEKPLDAKAVAHLALMYVKNLGLNVAEDALRGYLGNFNSQKIISEFEARVIDNTDILSSNLQIYSRGADLDKTAGEISIEYLIGILKDPDTSSKILAGDILDDYEGLSRLEIGNAMKDMADAIVEHNLDIDLDAGDLGRLNQIISTFAADPIEVIKKVCDEHFTGYKWEWGPEYFMTEEGQKMVKLMKNLKSVDGWYNLPDGHTVGELLNFYRIDLEDMYKSGTKLTQEMLGDLVSAKLSWGYGNKQKMGETIDLIERIITEDGYKMYGKNVEEYEWLLKKYELYDYDEAILERLRDFTGGYVSEGKLKSILGSLVYQTPEEFHYPGETKRVMGYNDGSRSILSLDYLLSVLRDTANHESLHQISHNTIFDSILGRNVTHAGVAIYQYDDAGNYIGKYMAGLNECITEFFNKLTMGSEFTDSSGYKYGVEKLEHLVDSGIISVDDLKKFYFTNDSAGLYDALEKSLRKLGLGSKMKTLVEDFDNIISDDDALREAGTKALNKLIKAIERGRIFSIFGR